MAIDSLEESSNHQKSLVSILYRVVILVFALLILLKYPGQFNWVLVSLCFPIYVALFLILRLYRNRVAAPLRLINDYLFIGIIIWNSQTLDLFTYSFLIIPVLNSQNHTGPNKSIVLYLIPLALVYFFNREITLSLFVVFIIFWVINSFDTIKNKFQNFYNKLNTTLDDFLVHENSLDRIHEIYDEIIPLFNDFNFFSKPIKDILCFQIINKDFLIINGSRFFYDIELESNNLIIESKSQLFKNLNLKLNDAEVNENIILRIKQETFDYVFVFIPEDESGLIQVGDTFFYKLLFPFFSRLSHIFNFKRLQLIDDRKNFNDIAKKVTYVNNAISSMHFTRNKLSPFTVYLSMMDDYNLEKDVNRKSKIEPHLKRERKKLKSSLIEILNRADSILEKSNNPFNVLNSQEQPFSNVMVKIREASSYYLKSEKFEYSIETSLPHWDKKVKINDTGMELVLSNWFSNVNKYKGEDYYGVLVDEDEKYFVLTFYNSFINKNLLIVPQFVVDFNSDDRMAILKRNGHGLIEIKDFLNQMDIDGRMYVKDYVLFFEVKFLKT